jgi:hypothetical protein
MTKATHGGPGRNQGRKHVNPTEPTVRVTVRLSQSQFDWLAARGNISDVVRSLIDSQMPVPVQNVSSSTC